jgi:transposase
MGSKALPPAEDIDALAPQMQALVRHYESELAKRDRVIAQHEAKLAEQHAEIQLLLARRFGASSEQVNTAQLGLFNEAELEADAADDEECHDARQVKGHTRRRGKRQPLPSHLPRVEVIHDLAEVDKVCPHDGAALEPLDAELSEQLRVVPAKFEVVVHRRLKYACTHCRSHVVTAPLPAQPIPKSMASAELLGYVATAKYLDALPLYRQSKQFGRIGVDLPRQTLARWMICLGALVTPLLNVLRDELLTQNYLQMDETTFQVLKEPGRAATSKSQLWVQRAMDPARPIVLFSYRASRSGATATELLGASKGVLQTDLYAGYHGPGQAPGRVHAHCFAHARRFFSDGLKSLGLNVKRLPAKPPPGATQLLKGLRLIAELYAIERRIRGTSPEQRLAVRERETIEVLDRLHQWVKATRPRAKPTSKLGKGLRYIEARWAGLSVFAHDGRVEIDTNLTENEIRPFAVGRRNWMFSDTPSGAHASAALYTLIVTAKANQLDPYAYLVHVARQLPSASCLADIEALLPWQLTPEAIAVR